MKRGSSFCSEWPSSAEFAPKCSNFCSTYVPSCPLPRTSRLFREGDKGDSMFVLEIGKVAVLKSWEGEDYLLRTLREGDCFGEMALIDHCPRSASVRAVEDCSAIQISAANLYRLYAQDLKQFALIQMNMGREVCRRLREADNMLFGVKLTTPHESIEHVFWAG